MKMIVKRYFFNLEGCSNPRAIVVDLNGCMITSDYEVGTIRVYTKFADDLDAGGDEVLPVAPLVCKPENVVSPVAVALK